MVLKGCKAIDREYCNGFDQSVARQQLRKDGPTLENRVSCVFCRTDRRDNRLAG
jgi:hypothetical protein